MVEHREGRFCPEDCINPGDAKCARSNHRAERRIQRMPAAAQNARRYFMFPHLPCALSAAEKLWSWR